MSQWGKEIKSGSLEIEKDKILDWRPQSQGGNCYHMSPGSELEKQITSMQYCVKLCKQKF